jgi:hypothetical protein
MTNFYNSGLYTEPFYNKISNLVFDEDFLLDTIINNYDVFFKHYSHAIEEVGQAESEVIRQMFYLSLKKISGKCLYFKPLIFNADIALECGLTPLVTPDIKINNNALYRSCHNFINILILSSSTREKVQIMDLSPRLDCYQVLTDNSIDEASYLFQDEEHFESVVGKSLTKKVIDTLSYKSQDKYAK